MLDNEAPFCRDGRLEIHSVVPPRNSAVQRNTDYIILSYRLTDWLSTLRVITLDHTLYVSTLGHRPQIYTRSSSSCGEGSFMCIYIDSRGCSCEFIDTHQRNALHSHSAKARQSRKLSTHVTVQTVNFISLTVRETL